MDFPQEIILKIASYLDRIDICNFRLAHSSIANTCSECIVRNGVSVLITAPCLDELRQLLQKREIETFTKELTLYLGKWPLCLQPKDWKEHELLFGSQISNGKVLRELGRDKTAKAYRRYSQFIAMQRNRTPSDDVVALFCTLILLPNLDTITVTDMKDCAKSPLTIQVFRGLYSRIWMTPYPSDEVSQAVETFLFAYGNGDYENNNVKTLNIIGNFNPALISLGLAPWCFRKIQSLNVDNIQLTNGDQGNQQAIKRFLSAFPDLFHLSIRFRASNPSFERDYLSDWPFQDSFLGQSFWPQLRTFSLDWLCTSEDKLFGIITMHRKTLQSVVFGHVSLTAGTWKSLSTRTQALGGKIDIKIERYGMLWDQYSVYVEWRFS